MRPDGSPIIQRMQDDMEAVIDKYRGEGVDLGACIGGLEVIKLNLWREFTLAAEAQDEANGEPWTPEI